MLPPLKPIPIKDRLSTLFLEKGKLAVLDGAFGVKLVQMMLKLPFANMI